MTIDVAIAKKRLQAAVKQGATEAILALQEASTALTPVGETGNLQNFTTTKVKIIDATAVADLDYNMIYATRQHEEVTWNHPRAGQAKFLETAMQQKQQEIKAIIASHVRSAL